MQDKSYDNSLNHITFKDFSIKYNRDTVFHLIDCYPDSPIYEEVIEEYEHLLPIVTPLIEPVALVSFGKIKQQVVTEQYGEGTPACYVLYSIGGKISALSNNYFIEGNYLAGMLVDAMANDYLFQMDHVLTDFLKEKCMERHFGVLTRLEVPTDIPMEAQETVMTETGADRLLGLGITEGFMFTTIKTNCFILVLTEDERILKVQHDCSRCDRMDCKLREIPEFQVDVIRGRDTFHISMKPGDNLMEALTGQGIYFSAACGGRGTCGKCRVQVIQGQIEISNEDRKHLSESELKQGHRLSCSAFPREACTIKLDTGDESDFEILSETSPRKEVREPVTEEAYGIAVDIGTTTIAVSLVGLTGGSILKTFTTVNKQRAYGADVISRMKASNEGKKGILQELIRRDLLQGFASVLEGSGIDKNLVKKIAIAGNTTMGHLLMGYSCENLGVYPFTPVNIRLTHKPFNEVFADSSLNADVILLPGISTYVGADIAAGLASCGFDRIDQPCVLIDLGTNGEMAVGGKDRILVTSTAAGPAFEGGNISCGVGSVNGAVCAAEIEDGKLSYRTIGEKPPVGICGTGVIEITSELVKAGIADETGLLTEEYFEEGYPVAEESVDTAAEHVFRFTQKDIREVQLAKAAVRAGLETLLMRYGVTYDQVETVYLAGGFGYKINVKKAVHIGLLPQELAGKLKAVGNSSLNGAVQYLTDSGIEARLEKLISISEEVNLSNDKDFMDLYIDHMYFE